MSLSVTRGVALILYFSSNFWKLDSLLLDSKISLLKSELIFEQYYYLLNERLSRVLECFPIFL